jgi:hypothetical protein
MNVLQIACPHVDGCDPLLHTFFRWSDKYQTFDSVVSGANVWHAVGMVHRIAFSCSSALGFT